MSVGASVVVGKRASHHIVFPVEALEARIRLLKNRVADLAYRSRCSRVVAAACRLLVRLTELQEELGEGVPVSELLPRLRLLESDVESLLRSPESFASSDCA
ncbi:hypothetical protein PABY_21610 [Pyrodictium abyssi]|uniref:Cell division protein ZapA n=1 Tax=Pyrodictium abyssi TaxID=54256 RepID=A0ABN6ZQS1_9CREN|nr:hypothetical protein PABY_21610 [Pyrodictium abyssi]